MNIKAYGLQHKIWITLMMCVCKSDSVALAIRLASKTQHMLHRIVICSDDLLHSKGPTNDRSHRLSLGARTRRTACREGPRLSGVSRARIRRNVHARRERAEEGRSRRKAVAEEAVEQNRATRRYQTRGLTSLTCTRNVRQSNDPEQKKCPPQRRKRMESHNTTQECST